MGIQLVVLLVSCGLVASNLVLAETEIRKVESSEEQYQAVDVINKSPRQLIEMRGFKAEVHYARTKDGYHIHLVNLINPEHRGTLKRPVIFNHGLMESSTIWLINSLGAKPMQPPEFCSELPSEYFRSNSSQFLNGPMLLANHGYDVWLMSMRGTDWSLRHDKLTPKQEQFWNYCLDDFALSDVPTVVNYVRKLRNVPKVAYVGHSQATFSVFGLLSAKPRYADLIEPVVAVAPVAFFDHITSLGRVLFEGTLTATNKDEHGPFPGKARVMRKVTYRLCDRKKEDYQQLACQLIGQLVSGKGDNWLSGFYNHLPFYTSLKVLRQFGQLITNKRFMMYDYGSEENLRVYGQVSSPSYPIENIRSRSLFLISTRTDALSHPMDVEKFRKHLRVPIYKDLYIDRPFDHFDLITHKDAKSLVFGPILRVMEEFEQQTGVCAANELNEYHGPDEIQARQEEYNSLDHHGNSGSDREAL